jgi:hypothetical protein
MAKHLPFLFRALFAYNSLMSELMFVYTINCLNSLNHFLLPFTLLPHMSFFVVYPCPNFSATTVILVQAIQRMHVMLIV